MIYILFFATIIFTLLNIMIANGDILHPGSIFGILFSIYEIACIIAKNSFEISFHANTVGLIISAFFMMTCLNIVYLGILGDNNIRNNSLEIGSFNYIKIDRRVLWGIFFVELATVLLFAKYLLDFSVAYDGMHRSLPRSIVLYSGVTKFYKKVYYTMSIKLPILFRIFNPISNACGYLFIYVLINNYFCTKKIDKLMLASVGVFCINIYLSGSRSPYFRIMTMCLILCYIYLKKIKGSKSIGMGFWIKVFIATIALCTGFILMLPLIGRNLDGGLMNYLFVYIGAPVSNLDQFINAYDIRLIGPVSEGQLFGAKTFGNIYEFIAKYNDSLYFQSYKGILTFTSSGGKNTGNVYTLFQYPLYDFGYIGSLGILFIMFSYYFPIYMKIQSSKFHRGIDYRLFLFSYLYNDIVMSVFTNRFFETLTDIGFLKIVIISYVFKMIIEERHIKTPKIKITRIKLSI